MSLLPSRQVTFGRAGLAAAPVPAISASTLPATVPASTSNAATAG